ncbi:cytochrome-c oxidase, cbb3-type subunit III [Maricaulis sp.]|jgi:cytochrome c oxidase cbb3-type subunit III|uniref:cytochrome-c oxidase, cbb3-type subunit III n=1 Tax=Maricaulis sp. TaxID=1486257 RepID=UPI00262EF47D|nr:cytochrome-c oxidase, cbb3-type subunit III [Maricaulis sp.]MDF1767490.1 cytochrome-c oxidase, cbb3-type subunit III [Maricaulis sp.]
MSEHDETRETDAHSGTETTGHEWDGIKELDTPLPRWWLYIFYACCVWAVIYWVLMPAWPALPGLAGETDHTRGLRNHSERANVAEALDALAEQRAVGFAALEGASIGEIENDPELLGFVLAAGETVFRDRCGTCHGVGGQGFVGYPNLNDDIWLWGGSYDDIRHTLQVGIRSEHPDTRFSQMPAFGRDELLSRAEIGEVTDYVLSLSGTSADAGAISRGQAIYDSQCASCHMADGRGDRAQGAPSLTDQDWLYGGSREQIMAAIHRGPYGVMPAWEDRLEETTLDALAAYVFLRGGGEDATAGPTGQ